MNKTSITKILVFFLLVGIEHINAASSNNLRKSKNTATSSFIDSISSIFMEENWTCCDSTNDPTPAPTATSSSSPTSIPTTSSPTYTKKKLTASDGTESDHFGYSCSMSGNLVIIGAHFSGENNEGAAYLYHLDGNEISKLTAGVDAQNNDFFGVRVSMDEKILVSSTGNSVQVFSLEGDYERTITCVECSQFGGAMGTYGERIVIRGYQNSSYKLFIHTTEGQLLKTIEDWDDYIYDVDISDEVIVFTTALKTDVYSNSDTDFEFIAEIPQGGRTVATSGDRVVIGDHNSNSNVGSAWLYRTDGTFVRTLGHNGERFGSGIDITDDKIIVGAYHDDEGGDDAGSVFIYSAATGDFQEKVLAPDGEAFDNFGSCVSASDSYFVVGSEGDDDNGETSGSAYLFPLSD